MADASSRGDDGKRFPLNLRTTREIREKIEQAAKQSGRSMSQEIEYRIERSFVDQDIANLAAINAVDRAFETLLGKGETRKLLVTFATAIKMIEIHTGKSLDEDEFTRVAVSQSLWMIYRTFYGQISDDKYSKSEQQELFELTRRTAAFAVGFTDLQASGKAAAWMDKHFPDAPK